MYSFVLSRLDYCQSLLIGSNCDQMYRLKEVHNQAAKGLFHKYRHEHVRPLIKAVHWLPVKERIIFEIVSFVSYFFDGTLPPYLSSFISMQTSSHTLRFSSDFKKSVSCARWELNGLVTGCSLFRLPLSETTFLLTVDTAVLSHSSKLLLKAVSLPLPTLSYSNLLTGIWREPRREKGVEYTE